MPSSRRWFLKQASSAAALGLLTQIPLKRLWALTPRDLVAPSDEALLRELALKAVDVARATGATFADVRVTDYQDVTVGSKFERESNRRPWMSAPHVLTVAGYGVRALVDGAWGFAAGYELTPDAVERAARAAVARARANRPLDRKILELTPAARIDNGRWATPIEDDPFARPFGEQGDMQLAALNAAVNVRSVTHASATFIWTRHDTVFASTEGALFFQRRDSASPAAGVMVSQGPPHTIAYGSVTTLKSGGYGYEALADTKLVPELRAAAEEADTRSKALRPPKPAEVGRYDVVFSGRMVGTMLAQTVGEALNLERALGYRANAEGTSFIAPPLSMLGELRVGSPMLTVHADRSQPHARATVGWDDEGVKPEAYTLIEQGVVTDYHTDRQTAPELAPWYTRHGRAVRSHGCAVGAGRERPRVGVPNLTMEPGPGSATEDDLIADTKRGIFVNAYFSGGPDQQLLSTQYVIEYGQTWEIRNGKRGERIEGMAVQFITPQFWKNIDALGGKTSMVKSGALVGGGHSVAVNAVPARVRQVNILNVGR